MKTLLTSFILFVSIGMMHSQLNPTSVGELFRDDVIPSIDITIDDNDFQTIITDIGSDIEYPATFRFNNSFIDKELDSIGFRLKGNVNRSIDKKSFKVSINTFKNGRKFEGFEKINLIGNATDALMLRPRLSWYIAREMGNKYLNTNYVRLFVNGTFKGIYVNTEQIDEIFLKKWFGNNSGNLYKCRYPGTLLYLSEAPDDYKVTNNYYGDRNLRMYELKTNTDKDDYTDLANFIKIINNTQVANYRDTINKYFNVPAFLKFLAFEVFIGHWDNYTTSTNNYMLYNNPATGLFEYMPFDTDLTFGTLGSSSAECNIYSITDRIADRPLANNILNIQEFRDIYSFYYRQLLAKFNEDSISNIVDSLRDKIRPYIFDDPFYNLFFTLENFENNTYEPAGMDNFGLLNFVNLRINAIKSQLEVSNTSPIISKFKCNNANCADTINVSCFIENEEEKLNVSLLYRFEKDTFDTLEMNLEKHKTIPFAQNCAASIPPFNTSGLLKIKIIATDENGKTSSFPLVGEYSINLYKTGSGLKINEILALNKNSITDEFGEHEDWIEIVNKDSAIVFANQCYLSDDAAELDKWKLPNKTLNPNDLFFVWADDDPNQGVLHTNFKLSGDGETVYLSEKVNNVIHILDSMKFDKQKTDISFGPEVEGSKDYDFLARITPGYINSTRNLAFAIFNIDMSYQIKKNNFSPLTDNIDVVGNFNNWESTISFADRNDDGMYTYTIFGLQQGDDIAYRFRMKHDNNYIEFKDNLGSEKHRTAILNEGCNTFNHIFDDDISVGVNELAENKGFTIYPNPVKEYFTIKSAIVPERVIILDAMGRKYFDMELKNSENAINVSKFPTGIYIVKAIKGNNIFTSKLIKVSK